MCVSANKMKSLSALWMLLSKSHSNSVKMNMIAKDENDTESDSPKFKLSKEGKAL